MGDARSRWLGWQQAHREALEALQQAEHDYQRLVMSEAFADTRQAPEDADARGRRQRALTRLEELRARLDHIREQQPPWPH